MVWAVISFDSKTPQVVIHGTLTVRNYVDDIQHSAVLPFRLQQPGTFMQYNAVPGRTRKNNFY